MDADPTTQVLVDGLVFPEGPRWHDGRLWFSDMQDRWVKAVDPDGTLERIVEVEELPSGLGWRPDGTLLVVSMGDRRLLAWDGEALTEVADLRPLTGGWCNDMVVDGLGRAYVGNFGYDLFADEPLRSTSLVLVDVDGRARPVADDLLFPNGTVITPDGATLVVGETRRARLTAFRVAADGSLSDRRLFAELDGAAVPDGICLDAEGAIWAASPRTQEVLRVLDGGRVTHRVSTGDRKAYACMLGGPDRTTLYVCTAVLAGPAAEGSRTGAIEFAEVGVPGAGWP